MALNEHFNRKTLFRVMLAALALTALSGVAAVVFPGTIGDWRIFTTAVIVAISCLLLMPTLAMLGTEKARFAGMFSLLWIVFMALVGVTSVWAELVWKGLGESLLVLVGWTFVCGLPVVPVLVNCQPKVDDLGVRVLMFAAAAAWIVLAVHAFMPWSTTAEKVAWTGLALLAAGVLLCACLAGVESQLRMVWRHAGVLASVAATLMALYAVWLSQGGDATWLVLTYAVGACVGYANLVRRAKIPPRAWWVRALGILFAGITGVLLTLAQAGRDIFEGSDLTNRLLLGSLIILGAVSAAIFILAVMHKRIAGKDLPPGDITHVQLTCPRCAKAQTVPVGQSACEGCRLRISLRVQLPICTKCEYDLSSVRGDRCPECGEPIAAASA